MWLKKNSFKVVVGIILVLMAFIIYYDYKNSSQSLLSKSFVAEDNQQNTAVENKVFPQSNVEWFNMFGNLSKGTLDSFEITWRTTGEVIDASEKPGKKEGYKHYRTSSEEGVYEYFGRIRLMQNNGYSANWYLSRRRMDLLKIYSMGRKGLQEASFADIKKGKRIEIEETVDLTVSNINDQNVKSVTIRIFEY